MSSCLTEEKREIGGHPDLVSLGIGCIQNTNVRELPTAISDNPLITDII
ncbi:hypothetical protein PoMZ_06329 [Pyricularia oryzae]|uniref:Uncharacterized protein n=1 Tax=Pyricularia oryzae TaxID=318829 RepID=A0A4P7NQG3_PYROR|nr:hypothetical protein PoMZ_06329 [Pyricularia oryzae]